jgi:hypothetical protein
MGIQNALLMTRFFTTMGHLVATLILFQTIQSNIEIGFGDMASTTDKQIAYQSSMGALAFSLLCFIIDMHGAVSGISIFNSGINLMQILFHFIGSIFLSWLITDNWNYLALWPIVVSCSLPTAIAEIFVLVVSNIRKSLLY